jgi:hypothetical protein
LGHHATFSQLLTFSFIPFGGRGKKKFPPSHYENNAGVSSSQAAQGGNYELPTKTLSFSTNGNQTGLWEFLHLKLLKWSLLDFHFVQKEKRGGGSS